MDRAGVDKLRGLRRDAVGVLFLFSRRDGGVGGIPSERRVGGVDRLDVHVHIRGVAFGQRQHAVLEAIRLCGQRGDRLDLAAIRGRVLHVARIHGGRDLDVVEVRRPSTGLAVLGGAARVRVAEADGVLALLQVHTYRSGPEVVPAAGVGEHQMLRGLAVHGHIGPTVHDLPGVA